MWLLPLVLLLCCSGCVHSTNSNSKVVFALTVYDAAVASDDLSLTLRAANDGVTRLATTEPEYQASIRPYLVRLARLNDIAITTIRQVEAGDTAADWKGAMLAIVAEASKTDPANFGFKNPSSRATVQLVFAGLNATIQAISASFGGK